MTGTDLTLEYTRLSRRRQDGSQVPMFVGKWHLEPRFVRFLLANCERWFLAEVYEQLDLLVERNVNLGFMDCHRADQLLGRFTTWNLHEDYIENARFERGQVNVFATASKMYRYLLVWYLKLQWRGFGVRALFTRERLRHLFHLSSRAVAMGLVGRVHRWRWRSAPANRAVAAMRDDFRTYRHRPALEPWMDGSGAEKVRERTPA